MTGRGGRPAVVAVVGPTASGKTALGLRLAEHLGTEIVSADSMQFYRHMLIGTGAPSAEELSRVRHHFIGFLEPTEEFSAGAFSVSARTVVADLHARGKCAVVVGGSGLYVRALIDGLFPGPGKDAAIRARLHEEAAATGAAELYARLRATDPDYAAVINANDVRRIVRALEVFELTGRPLSALHREHRQSAESLDAVQIGLDMPRVELYGRINARVDRMIEMGLLDEVRGLLKFGYAGAINQLRSLGYREMAAHIRGEMAFEEAVEHMKRNTRRFAKRQLTWFRADRRVRWIPAGARRTEGEVFNDLSGLLERYGDQR